MLCLFDAVYLTAASHIQEPRCTNSDLIRGEESNGANYNLGTEIKLNHSKIHFGRHRSFTHKKKYFLIGVIKKVFWSFLTTQ